MEPSEEADERQLELAREEGDAYQRSAEYMIEEVAHTGAVTEKGDYIIGIAQEEAEGLYRVREDRLVWEEPENENCHLEIIVADREDGRFIPYLVVHATFIRDGKKIQTHDIPFIWHPGLYHYGKNVELPGDGEYDIRVEVEPPGFERHDRRNGERYTEKAEVTFENVDVETGRT